MTHAYLLLAVLAAGMVAFLVREYVSTFLVTAGLTWLFAIAQMLLDNVGCRYAWLPYVRDPVRYTVYAAPLALVVGLIALLFAYAIRQYEARP